MGKRPVSQCAGPTSPCGPQAPITAGKSCLHLCFVLSVFELALGCFRRFAGRGAPGAGEEGEVSWARRRRHCLSPSCDGAGQTPGESGRPRKALRHVSGRPLWDGDTKEGGGRNCSDTLSGKILQPLVTDDI